MKKKINEKMGGGMRIGLGGTNAAGPYYNYHQTKNPTGHHTGGYTGNADSQISQRHSSISTFEEEIDEDIEDEDLMEFFARIMKMPLTEEDQQAIDELDEEEVKEMAVAGATTPLGTNAKGEIPSKDEERERHIRNKKYFGGLK